MTNASALPAGTELAGNFRIERVLGAGGFGITYLAQDLALKEQVTIKEYFPNGFAAREADGSACPRTAGCAEDYRWGLDRFLAEAQTLARFKHPNIVRVRYFFAANSTGYMVLDFEEGQSFKAWLKNLGRAPRQNEIDGIVAPLLDALDTIHKEDFLHRDIAPDNIIIRKNGAPVLIDFGSARGEIASHSRTVSALVKPGYSPYEQYAERTSGQGPWTDIYALAATLYHAVTGTRPPDAPSRLAGSPLLPAHEAALSAYRPRFLAAIDRALALEPAARPQTVAAWRGELLAPHLASEGAAPAPSGGGWLTRVLDRRRSREREAGIPSARAGPLVGTIPPPPDAPGPQGGLLDFLERLQATTGTVAAPAAPPASGGAPAAVQRSEARGRENAAGVAPVDGTANAAEPTAPRPPPRVLAPERRRRVKPRPMGNGVPLRPLFTRLAIGVAIAAAAVSLQHKIPRAGSRGSAVPSSQYGQTVLAAVLRGHTGAVTAAAYAEDGQTLATAGADATLRLWNGAGRLVRTIELDHGPANAIAFLGGRVLTGHSGGEIDLWDAASASKTGAFRRNEAAIGALTYTGEPYRFAAGSADGKVALWDVRIKEGPVHVFEGHNGPVKTLAYSPQGPLLASGGAGGTLRLWNPETLAFVRVYRGHRDTIESVAFSPGGRTLASVGTEGQVRLWSTAARRLLRTLRLPSGGGAALAFLPEGILAAGGSDGIVRLWEWRRRARPVESLPGHLGPVTALTFSLPGLRLVSASSDGTLRIWTPQSFHPPPAFAGR